MIALVLLAACGSYDPKHTCEFSTADVLTATDDSVGFSVEDSEALVNGGWAGELSYACDGDDGAIELISCDGAPSPEELTLSLTIGEQLFPISGSAATGDEECKGNISLDGDATASVPSGAFSAVGAATTIAVYGANGAATAAASQITIEVPDESPIAAYGTTLLLTVNLGDPNQAYITRSDVPEVILATADPLTRMEGR